ncbi:LysR family transcriptional regulator [Undibacterium sp. 5I1]|nr:MULTISPECIES: LysR family transcriptional regulator [unclassified Undibacterium]MDY7537238.1 LysR family transcriptional regulator [Undibacterium sp. 5I1]
MKNNHELTLDDLSVFVAVCKANGFRAAANQLGLSPSHVSEIITRIEKQLGLPLLIRNTRSVMPTEAGRLLESRLSPLLMRRLLPLGSHVMGMASYAHLRIGLIPFSKADSSSRSCPTGGNGSRGQGYTLLVDVCQVPCVLL